MQINIAQTSPFRGTSVFSKAGVAFFGVWVPPTIVMDGDEPEVIVQDGKHGQLDLLANEYYGDRRLWWVIAHVNQINLPLEDVYVGMKLKIPKRQNVELALMSLGGSTVFGEVAI